MQFIQRCILSKTIKFCAQTAVRHKSGLAHEYDSRTYDKEEPPPAQLKRIPYSRYGGETTVTLITRSKAGKDASEYLDVIIDHIHAPVHFEKYDSVDINMPGEVLLSVQRNGSVLFLDVTVPDPDLKLAERAWKLNTKLDLFACVTNCFSIPGFTKKFKPADMVILMQNNRGDFSKLEYAPAHGMVESLKISEYRYVRRYVDFAFNYAQKHDRKLITFAHKVEELPLSDGLMMKASKYIGRRYPKIHVEHMAVNTMVRTLMWNPSQFDILCLSDNYGTSVLAAAGGVCGGAGLYSSSEMGDHYAIFKPLETKLSIVGPNSLSPYGVISAVVNLFEHLGYRECASKLWRALMQVMLIDKVKTAEFGGKAKDEDVITKLLEHLRENACRLI